MNPERDPIKISEDMYAPPFARYVASFGDWDLGDPIGTGATAEEAIADLKMDAGEDDHEHIEGALEDRSRES